MLTLQQLYKILEFERKQVLEHYSTVDEIHFHYQDKANTWSPEMIFRHILMSIRWMSGLLPKGPLATPDLAILPGLNSSPKYKATLEEINTAFNLISPVIREHLGNLTIEQANEEVQTKNFSVIRKVVLTRLITHEYKHLGQITWLLKRSTGWTDENLYNINFDETTWDIPELENSKK